MDLRPSLALNLFVAAMAAAAPLSAQAVKICPLGDSITESFAGMPSYRFHLDRLLCAGGFDFDLVGSMTGVAFGAPGDTDFDQNHEGHSGWSVDDVLPHIGAWTAASMPDIFIVHLGTNDMLRRHTVQSTLDELDEMIDRIRLAQPAATVILAQIIPMQNRDEGPLNTGIAALAAAMDTPTSRVVAADLNSNFDSATMRWIDGVHPTQAGEEWIAQRFYDALLAFLPAPTDSYEAIGTGCAPVGGSGDALSLTAAPSQCLVPDRQFTAEVRGIPSSDAVSFGILSAFRYGADGFPPAIELDAIGMTGCTLHVVPMVTVPLVGVGDTRSWTLDVPNDPDLVGSTFYQQALVIDAQVNAFGALLSEARAGTIGSR